MNLNNILIVHSTDGLALSDDGANALNVSANNLTVAHLTGVGVNSTTTATGSTLSVTDSLFVDIQGLSVFAGTAPTTENYNAFYQTPGTGNGANNVTLTADPLLTDWFLDQASPVINAGSTLAPAAGMYHYSTDTAGTIEANSQTDIGYHSPPDILSFSVLATNSIEMDMQVTIHSGNVGVNEATAGPFLKPEAALYFHKSVSIPSGSRAFSDSVYVHNDAVIDGDVFYNQLTELGIIAGSKTTPLSLPIIDALPLFRSAELGTVSNITVASGEVLTLAPGSYGIITVEGTGTIEFTGGVYHIQSLFAKKDAALNFNAPSEVRIQGDFRTNKSVYIGPAPGSELNASDLLFYVEGVNVITPHMDIGQSNLLFGHVFVPNGQLRMGESSQMHGVFVGKDVRVGKSVQVNLQVAPQANTVAAPLIMPPGGLFFDSVTVKLFTITSGTTIHYTTDGTDPTTLSPVFTAPFTLTTNVAPQAVKAIAVRSGFNDSSITSATFNVTPRPTTEDVTFDPVAGTYFDSVTVTLSSATPGATIHFTTDGTVPTTASPIYTTPFSLSINATPHTVQALAAFTDFNDSAVTSAVYTVQLRPTTEVVTFSPPAGTFQDLVDVTLSSATAGATIFYTTDGSDPTAGSAVFSTPINLTATATIKAFAIFPDFFDSAINSATYTIDTTPPIPGTIPNAPSLDETLIYNVATSTSFLYTGPNAVQTGMDPATIEPVRAAVVRGEVKQLDPTDINAAPLPLQGVTVTIMGHDDPLGSGILWPDGFACRRIFRHGGQRRRPACRPIQQNRFPARAEKSAGAVAGFCHCG